MVERSKEIHDVAVIGAGIAGLYTAWRLLESGQVRSVVVLEKENRVGGRLKTAFIEHDHSRILVEDGGMRFLRNHTFLMRLLNRLGLAGKITPFGMGDENNLYYIRGRRFTRAQAKDSDNRIWSELYSLNRDEQGKSPFQIISEIKDRLIRPYDGFGLDWTPTNSDMWARLRKLSYEGFRLYDWGLRSLLAEMGYSNECVQMLIDTGGFSIPYEEQVNAGSGLQLIANFPENPEFFTLCDGYQELPMRLSSEIEKLGGRIRLGHEVIGVARCSEGYELSVLAAYLPQVYARNVVVAIPARPLKKLLSGSKGHKLGHLDMIVHMPLTKINLYFEEPWWENDYKITTGGCFTDLALAQVYVFKLEPSISGRKFNAVTIYSDGRRGNFWRQLQELGRDYAQGNVHVPPDLVVCKQAVVRHCKIQLKEMFGRDEIPDPVFATISMWGTAIGEGDHQWALGADDEIIRSELWCFDNEGLYLCGEAISDEQDWVEGSLRSSERVLTAGFKLRPFFSSQKDKG